MTPVLDLRRRELPVGEALVETGFVILEHHGVPGAAWHRAVPRRRHARSRCRTRSRRAIAGQQTYSQRGYLPARTVLPDGRAALDRKECWHGRRVGHRHGNLFPDEVPELTPAVLELIAALDALADRILAALDAYLGRDPGLLVGRVRDGDSLFRINHYPGGDAGTRFQPHRDFDLITFLFGATQPGLEVETRDGRWQPIAPSRDGLVVNAGDLLAIESGGRIPSTRHRVVAPPVPDGGRISMVYFVAPRPEVRLGDGRAAGDVIDTRLREAGYLR
ncbi:MAG: 2OG-Fe(II) oxygenase family protein [Candidatus Binatia bacterium]